MGVHATFPPKVREFLNAWHLVPDDPLLTTRSSWVLPARHEGSSAMLKVARIPDEQSGYRLMTWRDGQGAAKVVASSPGALLVERATDTRNLAQMAWSGRDDEACRVLCDTAARLHAPRRNPPPVLHPLEVGSSRSFNSRRNMQHLPRRQRPRASFWPLHMRLAHSMGICPTRTSSTLVSAGGWRSIPMDCWANGPSTMPTSSRTPISVIQAGRNRNSRFDREASRSIQVCDTNRSRSRAALHSGSVYTADPRPVAARPRASRLDT